MNTVFSGRPAGEESGRKAIAQAGGGGAVVGLKNVHFE